MNLFQLQESRDKAWIPGVPLGPLMTWRTQCWEYNEHLECRCTHRFFNTKLIMADAVILRKKMCLLEGVSPTSSIGHIWVSTCTIKGTAVNISCLNKVYNYNAPILGNFYEILTTNDINAFYVGVVVYTPQSTDAIIAKFWLTSGGELNGGFRHYVNPRNSPLCYKMKVQPHTTKKDGHEELHYDGGMESCHVSGSFPDQNTGVIGCLRLIVNTWGTFARIGEGKFWVNTTGRQDNGKWCALIDQASMRFTGNQRTIHERFPNKFKLNISCIIAIEKVNKYLSDNPYFSEPFYIPMSRTRPSSQQGLKR